LLFLFDLERQSLLPTYPKNGIKIM